MNIDNLTRKADALQPRSDEIRDDLVHTRFAFKVTGELKGAEYPLNHCAHQIKKLLNGVKKYLIPSRENNEVPKQMDSDNGKLSRVMVHWLADGCRTEKKPHVYMTQNMTPPKQKEGE